MKKVDLLYGDYERVKNAIGNTMYFEFELQFENCERELDRFLWESRKEMTEYKNRYSGPVVVDISKWNRQQDKSFFEAFLYFLKDNDNELTIIMTQKPSKQLLLCLEKHFIINTRELFFKEQKETKTRIGFYCREENDYVRS